MTLHELKEKIDKILAEHPEYANMFLYMNDYYGVVGFGGNVEPAYLYSRKYRWGGTTYLTDEKPDDIDEAELVLEVLA